MTYCYNCGKEVPAGAKFCPNCAAPVAFQQAGQPDLTPSPSRVSGISRPRGTRVLVLIDFIMGIVVAGIGIQTFASPVSSQVSASEWYAIGAIFFIFGLLSVVVGYGLWKAMPWAWLLGLWAGVVYVVLGVLAVHAVPGVLILLVGIANLLFYYFDRADLKRYLGKVRP